LAEVKSQLASLQKNVYHLTNVEKELVDCRIVLATTQKSHEEVQHTADARAEEIRILYSQLAAVTVKTKQAKFGSLQIRGKSIKPPVSMSLASKKAYKTKWKKESEDLGYTELYRKASINRL
jgi:hypothetical protein